METFSALLALCAGNFPVTGEFPAQRPVTRNFDVFFDLRLKKRLNKNNRDAGDLRRHRAHYDVIVMIISKAPSHWSEGILIKRSEGIDQETGFFFFFKSRHDFPGGNALKSR